MRDGALLLWSVAMFAPLKTPVFVATDHATADWFHLRMPMLAALLDIKWSFALDKYDMRLRRGGMIKAGVWNDFQMEKARIMELALGHANDTLFLDADCMVLAPTMLPSIESGAQLGLAPHYMKVEDSREFGFFNGGLVWTNQQTTPRDWIQATTPESRYYDQTALEDLAEWYRTYIFGPETDLGWWRIKHGSFSTPGEFWRQLTLDASGRICVRGKVVDTVHGHILSDDTGNSKAFLEGILGLMGRSHVYDDLLDVIKWGQRGFEPPLPRVAYTARGNNRVAVTQT